ncbi:hypothetical protein GRX03_15305 [Halovenus sp. WSH3]|uniref:Halobacterial output domain-containing protein n=1 Tax=Halovenus carboxidivorans TaxID=2692199 RepID=A0A6B0T9Q1_9EURY|nr:HalOD1 output domain-containing protein [Halovenus carboxidivorans]MXR52966.1 hypothetical protein [Halovenus carboxidivorans]
MKRETPMVGARRDVNGDELPGERTTKCEFDWNNDGGAPVAVVETVASVTEQCPTEMEPLSRVIDTDALDELFASTRSTPRKTGYIQFQYQGCYVRVSAEGTVYVSLPAE